MTLPASGLISIANINTEIGRPSTQLLDLNYANSLIKAAQRPATPNLNSFHNKAWYRKTNAGNCNNGNCNCNCNCGDGGNCVNCQNCNAVNCVNCDSQNWLQTNCNCACTYNCSSYQCWTINCLCDCDCL